MDFSNSEHALQVTTPIEFVFLHETLLVDSEDGLCVLPGEDDGAPGHSVLCVAQEVQSSDVPSLVPPHGDANG